MRTSRGNTITQRLVPPWRRPPTPESRQRPAATFDSVAERYHRARPDLVYEGLPPGTRFVRPGELPDARAEIEDSGLFGDVAVRQFDWEIRYVTEGYIALLDTFSGHIAMEPWQRERLHSEIRRRLAARADGMLRRHWGAVLHVARRRD